MNLLALPAFTDNYIWMLHDGQQAVVVDPGDSAPVRHALARLNLELAGILVTHRHPDHVNGLAGLRPLLAGQVYGPGTEPIPGPIEAATEGQVVRMAGWDFQVMEVPGHTAGHVAYLLATAEPPLLFCGDTLFSGGCGRLEDSTYAQLHASLQRLAGLPATTRVCCTHEYTLANMKFARVVEPGNPRVVEHLRWCEVQRRSGRPTLPSSIELEREINPFLRCNQPAVVQAAHRHSGRPLGDSVGGELAVFTVLRQWKNEFQ